MKVFKFHSEDDLYYTFSGATEEIAKEAMYEHVGEFKVTKTEEIPESKWDIANIKIYEDNDRENEPYNISIRDCMSGDAAIMICSNDASLI